MGLLDNTTQKEYYQGGNLGSYQFVSLEDVINQFMAVYVGEDKIIPKAKKADVAFHAQRALAEMSFDVFRSIKSQQIDLPASLTMMLPHDYINYTKVSWVDGSGIKHLLYPTKHTNNPFQIKQSDDGSYEFAEQHELVANNDFSGSLEASPWELSPFFTSSGLGTDITVVDGVATFGHSSHHIGGGIGFPISRTLFMSQKLDVSDLEFVNISATGSSAAASSIVVDSTTYTIPASTIRFGITTEKPTGSSVHDVSGVTQYGPSPNTSVDMFDVAYLEWTAGASSTESTLMVDVSNYTEVWVTVVSFAPFSQNILPAETLFTSNTIDDISVQNAFANNSLAPAQDSGNNSSTWDSYSSATPSENTGNNYEDDTYWPLGGERYGLEPSHAQVNGSFYIDDLRGKINFSSNISGKTVILDYISDSLGTDGEMQVPKLAEDAIYKHILCDIVSARANIGRGQLAYYRKQKFAAVRKAKLRLSNIKLEELTQILRGKSKQIKH
jgi:hypothetical protein